LASEEHPRPAPAIEPHFIRSRTRTFKEVRVRQDQVDQPEIRPGLWTDFQNVLIKSMQEYCNEQIAARDRERQEQENLLPLLQGNQYTVAFGGFRVQAQLSRLLFQQSTVLSLILPGSKTVGDIMQGAFQTIAQNANLQQQPQPQP